jgi:hypothetical protein
VFNTFNTNKIESTELAITPREATEDEWLDFYLDDAPYRKRNGQSGVNVELGMEHIFIVTIVDKKYLIVSVNRNQFRNFFVEKRDQYK